MAVSAVVFTGAQQASAAVIGSLDNTRTYQVTTKSGEMRDQSILGNYYSKLHDHLAASGSTFAAGAQTVTADYLAGIDLFITGTPTLNSNAAGAASAAEQDALRDWVSGGGVAFLIGEAAGMFSGDVGFEETANSWLGTFGLSISGNYGRGTGRWTASDNALLDGVNEGSLNALAMNTGGMFAEDGAYDILARYGTSATRGQAGIVALQYGDGYVIASGDASPFTNERFEALMLDGVRPTNSANFVDNIVALADQPAPVPLPATLPLALAGVGAFGALRRFRRA